jgi:hypothetical protein
MALLILHIILDRVGSSILMLQFICTGERNWHNEKKYSQLNAISIVLLKKEKTQFAHGDRRFIC